MKNKTFLFAILILIMFSVVKIGSFVIEMSIKDKMPDVVFNCVQSAQESSIIQNNIGYIKTSKYNKLPSLAEKSDIAFEVELLGEKGKATIKYSARKMIANDGWVILKSDTTYLLN